jgi:hypothetical protein
VELKKPASVLKVERLKLDSALKVEKLKLDSALNMINRISSVFYLPSLNGITAESMKTLFQWI